MRRRHHYKDLFNLVRSVVRDWDPYGLIAGGAPDDEWDGEARSLVKQVRRIRSAIDAAHAVSRVFSSSFHPKGFGPDDCREVGQRVFDALRDAGVLHGD
jgi:hypothetical protein